MGEAESSFRFSQLLRRDQVPDDDSNYLGPRVIWVQKRWISAANIAVSIRNMNEHDEKPSKLRVPCLSANLSERPYRANILEAFHPMRISKRRVSHPNKGDLGSWWFGGILVVW